MAKIIVGDKSQGYKYWIYQQALPTWRTGATIIPFDFMAH